MSYIDEINGRSDLPTSDYKLGFACAEVDRLRTDLAASESRCAALAKECEEISAKLDAIYSAVDGYVDGAPDAGPVAKLANEVSLIINSPQYP